MLKVSPRKGVIRFRKQGKLNPRYIGPFKILERIGPMAYKLELPKELSDVHSTFHASNIKKCLSDESHIIPIKELQLDDKLNFMEEPVEIMDPEIKELRQSRIPIVKDLPSFDSALLVCNRPPLRFLMPPKRNSASAASASEAPAMAQAAIKQLVIDSVTTALETQAATMANVDNGNGNPKLREALVARKCRYKEFISFQPFNLKGSEGVIRLLCWFEHIELVFSCSNCTEDCKVKFATGTLTEEALSWCNSFAQPIGIEEDYKIIWVEFK
nr:putative reverse transcriptase domain-containing protein [Tanacetum cinerariifolium]